MFAGPTKGPKTTFLSATLILISLGMFGLLVFTDYFSISRLSPKRGREASKSVAVAPSLAAAQNHQKTFQFPQLEITSDFETGNLHDAVSLDKQHYSLEVGPDPMDPVGHGYRHKNWFHFRTKSSFPVPKSVKFTIHHLEKNWAIWTHGCALAYQSNLKLNNTWQILNATEFKVLIRAKGLALEFVYTFEVGEDTAFALSFPYSRSQLNAYLNSTEADFRSIPGFVFRRETLVRSNLGYPVEILTLSDSSHLTQHLFPKLGHLFPDRTGASKATATPNFAKSKRVYVVAARVHPSEAASSYLLEGFLDRLKQQDNSTQTFFNRSVLYVVPMLNPDGVQLGFTRCDANGFNLNARYKGADLHTPSIYALKKFMKHQSGRSKVRMFLDLHAHFTRRGFFIFGNPLRPKSYRHVLEFPFLLKRHAPQFSLLGSRFGSVKTEESTSRKELFKLTKLRNVYTVEVNYWGGKTDQTALRTNKLIQNNLRKVTDFGRFYTPDTFRRFGNSLADSLLAFDRYIDVPSDPQRTKMLAKIDGYFQRFTQRRAKRSGDTIKPPSLRPDNLTGVSLTTGRTRRAPKGSF